MKAPASLEQNVGARLVESDLSADRLDEATKSRRRRAPYGRRPRAWWRSSVRAPGMIVDPLREHPLDDVGRQPFNSATRSRSAGSKAISPRMARSVIAATSVAQPDLGRSSSMHSCSIMVESMSAIEQLSCGATLAGTTFTSIGGPRSAARAASRAFAGSPSKGISQASSGASQSGAAASAPDAVERPARAVDIGSRSAAPSLWRR